MRAVFFVLAFLTAMGSASTRAAAAAPDFDAEYFGESAFLSVQPGATNTFTVFFGNTGSQTWGRGTATQVQLAICRQDKVTCNVLSPNAAWNDGTWLSPIAYATTTQDSVAPGQVGTFTYRIRTPLDARGGEYQFHGDLAVSRTLRMIHPVGYYQTAVISDSP